VSSTLFLDTSGWFAAMSGREAAHTRTRLAYREHLSGGGTLVTTVMVVAEMHVLLLKLGGPAVAIRFLDGVTADLAHEVVDVDRDLRLAATERWLRRFADQEFSLTDAVSFEVMRRRKLRRALALDQHFVVAGFEVLPGRA
jgi:hypothetical protein